MAALRRDQPRITRTIAVPDPGTNNPIALRAVRYAVIRSRDKRVIRAIREIRVP